MASQAKESVDRAVHRKQPLRVPRRFAPAQLVFSLVRRLVRDFHSIVSVAILALAHVWQELTAGSAITPQVTGHQQTGNIQ